MLIGTVADPHFSGMLKRAGARGGRLKQQGEARVSVVCGQIGALCNR
jgi:hypothetical protein